MGNRQSKIKLIFPHRLYQYISSLSKSLSLTSSTPSFIFKPLPIHKFLISSPHLSCDLRFPLLQLFSTFTHSSHMSKPRPFNILKSPPSSFCVNNALPTLTSTFLPCLEVETTFVSQTFPSTPLDFSPQTYSMLKVSIYTFKSK